MDRLLRFRAWLTQHREEWLDLLRVYLGCALLAKGVDFFQTPLLGETLKQAQLDFADGLLAHYVVLAHLGGGFLLAIGLLTRLAAAIQLPALLGAVVFVHAQEGLFTAAMRLELALLVLFLLVLFAFAGAGRWSVDSYLARRSEDLARTSEWPKPHARHR